MPKDRYGHHYLITDRLVPTRYNLPVLSLSFFHVSGWGYRSLSIDELAHAHGFPRNLVFPRFPKQLLDCPPCQLLLAGVSPVWAVISPAGSDPNPKPLKRRKEESLTTYLPNIKKYLPHTWIDISLITATARKSDDAAAPCSEKFDAI